jgi:site-specific recombinase XerD
MSVKTAGRGLCCVNGRYRRTIGRFINSEGKSAPKKFLLGTDKRAAQLANLRLEQLWADVVRLTEEGDLERAEVHQRFVKSLAEDGATLPQSATPQRQDPMWDEEALEIAESIRGGVPHVAVPVPDLAEATDRDYVEQIARLRRQYPSVTFVPIDTNAFQRGQATYRDDVARHTARATAAAAVADVPLPTDAGQTLHAAIDDYVRWIKETKVKAGRLTAWGKVLAEQVRRLKDAHPDVPLGIVDYNALEKVKTYWASRPVSKQYGKPLAIDTVRTQLSAARMFVKWLHKNPSWRWRKPDEWEDALKCDLASLMTDDEIANLKRGPETYTVEELATLYHYATDRERLLILLALNIGAARAECSSLRIDEVDLHAEPATIKRIRRKTRTYGEFTLWPETAAALRWVAAERARVVPSDSKLAIVTERGRPLSETRIANQWNRLVERVQRDLPDFRFLPFKYLRKTAAQLIRNVSDGETAGTFLCHGTPVKTDELSDVYSRRDFSKVFAALANVRKLLEPTFRRVDGSFSRPRNNGSANISRGTIDRIAELHLAGLRPEEIARRIGVSRATAYRRVSQLKQWPAAVTPPMTETSETNRAQCD